MLYEVRSDTDQIDFDTLMGVGRTVEVSATGLQQRTGHLNVVMTEVK